MNPDQLFSIANAWVLPAWLLLAIVPRWKYTQHIVIIASVLPMAVLYAILLFSSFSSISPDTFGSLESIGQAFTSKFALLTGWVHYLAFDLFVGYIITYDALKNRIHAVIRIPALFFTLMSGPFGWLLYFVARTIIMRKFQPYLTH